MNQGRASDVDVMALAAALERAAAADGPQAELLRQEKDAVPTLP